MVAFGENAVDCTCNSLKLLMIHSLSFQGCNVNFKSDYGSGAIPIWMTEMELPSVLLKWAYYSNCNS